MDSSNSILMVDYRETLRFTPCSFEPSSSLSCLWCSTFNDWFFMWIIHAVVDGFFGGKFR